MVAMIFFLRNIRFKYTLSPFEKANPISKKIELKEKHSVNLLGLMISILSIGKLIKKNKIANAKNMPAYFQLLVFGRKLNSDTMVPSGSGSPSTNPFADSNFSANFCLIDFGLLFLFSSMSCYSPVIKSSILSLPLII